jgi:hypothetical protein
LISGGDARLLYHGVDKQIGNKLVNIYRGEISCKAV